jgi:hypothetical protein
MNILNTTIIDNLETDGCASAIQQSFAKAPDFGALPSGTKRVAIPALIVIPAAPTTPLSELAQQPVIVLIEQDASEAQSLLDNAINTSVHIGVIAALNAQV